MYKTNAAIGFGPKDWEVYYEPFDCPLGRRKCYAYLRRDENGEEYEEEVVSFTCEHLHKQEEIPQYVNILCNAVEENTGEWGCENDPYRVTE